MAYSNTKAFKLDLNVGLPKLSAINRGVLIKISNILGESPKQVPRGGHCVTGCIVICSAFIHVALWDLMAISIWLLEMKARVSEELRFSSGLCSLWLV